MIRKGRVRVSTFVRVSCDQEQYTRVCALRAHNSRVSMIREYQQGERHVVACLCYSIHAVKKLKALGVPA